MPWRRGAAWIRSVAGWRVSGPPRWWANTGRWFTRLLAARMRRYWPRPSLGRRGEAAAARYLRRRGYRIVSRGLRDGSWGEIDLIAVDGRTLVFVEVKTRRSSDAGYPAESVDPRKQRRLTGLALSYLRRHDLLEYRARFDVVGVIWPPDQRKPRLEHIRGAFPAIGPSGQFFR